MYKEKSKMFVLMGRLAEKVWAPVKTRLINYPILEQRWLVLTPLLQRLDGELVIECAQWDAVLVGLDVADKRCFKFGSGFEPRLPDTFRSSVRPSAAAMTAMSLGATTVLSLAAAA